MVKLTPARYDPALGLAMGGSLRHKSEPRPAAARRAACLTAGAALLLAAPASAQQGLPAPMAYLRGIDASIIQDMRYATEHNFTGRRVPGYDAEECILHKRAAAALSRAQGALRERGLSLKVYDCYRPQRAVRAFVAWANDRAEAKTKRFYPRLSKRELLTDGYIAPRSNHSRGVVVDAALVRLPPPQTEPFDPARTYGDCTAPKEQRPPDSSIDFGTDFDCFDERSHTESESVTQEQSKARAMFVAIMAEHGFANYRREWWHFTFTDASRGPSYDFPIRSPQAATRN
jgi:zinc D-Ala-D-Ala dipeptidase